MCGIPGLHMLTHGIQLQPAQGNNSQSGDITHEIKMRYARGEITSESFYRLIEMAKGGYLTWDDLLNTQAELPLTHASGSGTYPLKESQRSNEDIPLHEQSQALTQLEIQAMRLRVEARSAQQDAHKPGLSEEETLALLETSQGALFRAEAIERQIDAMRTS